MNTAQIANLAIHLRIRGHLPFRSKRFNRSFESAYLARHAVGPQPLTVTVAVPLWCGHCAPAYVWCVQCDPRS